MSAGTEEFPAVRAASSYGLLRRFARTTSYARDADSPPRDGVDDDPDVDLELPWGELEFESAGARRFVTASFSLPADELDTLQELAARCMATRTDLVHEPSCEELETPGRRAQWVHACFNLPPEEVCAIEELAARRATTPTQVVIQCVGTEVFLQRMVDKGASIFAGISGRGREILLAHMRV